MDFSTVSGHESAYVELSFAAFVVHEADFTEHGALGPALVVDTANGPHAT